MSYVLHIWEGPEPVNAGNVMHILDFLKMERCKPNPKIMALAERLMKRYPYEDDDAGAWSVWTDGEIDGRSDTPVYALGVALPSPSVLHFVTRSAMMLDLNVYDPQTGRTCFASGSVYPPYTPAELAQQSQPEGLMYSELKRQVNQALKSFLEADGFYLEKDGLKLVRRIEGGRQGVNISVWNRYPEWEFSLGFYVDFEVIEDIQYRLFDREDPSVRASRVTEWFSLSQWIGEKPLRVVTAQDVRRALAEVQPVIVQRALPLLKTRTSMRRFVDAHLGSEPGLPELTDSALAIRLLIAARLTRSPRFGALALQLAQAWKEKGEALRSDLARLLKYLQGIDPDRLALPEMYHACPYPPVDLRPGERVQHPMDGFGVVRKVTGQGFGTSIHVDFDNGERSTLAIQGRSLLVRV